MNGRTDPSAVINQIEAVSWLTGPQEKTHHQDLTATAQHGAVAPEHGRPDSAAGQGDSEFSPSLALSLQKQSSVKSYIRVNVATQSMTSPDSCHCNYFPFGSVTSYQNQ